MISRPRQLSILSMYVLTLIYLFIYYLSTHCHLSSRGEAKTQLDFAVNADFVFLHHEDPASDWCLMCAVTKYSCPKNPLMVDLTSCKGWKSAKPVLRPNSIITFWFRFRKMPKGLDHNHCNQVGPTSAVPRNAGHLDPVDIEPTHGPCQNVDSDRNFRDITISF